MISNDILLLSGSSVLQIRDFSEQIISEKNLDSAIELRLAHIIAMILIMF